MQKRFRFWLIVTMICMLLLTSCKTSKPQCEAYSIYRVPYNDSIIVSQWHEHIEFDGKKHCIFVPKEIIYYSDTIEFRIPITYQYHKLN